MNTSTARHARPGAGRLTHGAHPRGYDYDPRGYDYDQRGYDYDQRGYGADPLVHPIAITERAVIGDQIRIPIAACDMAPCMSWYSDPAALGERDMRARAIRAGWRLDALRRLVCPACQGGGPAGMSRRPG